MKITKLTPNFEVTDVKQTVAYYEETFGFKLVMTVPETQDGIEQSFTENKNYVYAMMQKDNVEIFFQRTDTFKEDVVYSQDLTNNLLSELVAYCQPVTGVPSVFTM